MYFAANCEAFETAFKQGAPVHKPWVDKRQEAEGEEQAVQAVQKKQNGAETRHDEEIAEVPAEGVTCYDTGREARRVPELECRRLQK